MALAGDCGGSGEDHYQLCSCTVEGGVLSHQNGHIYYLKTQRPNGSFCKVATVIIIVIVKVIIIFLFVILLAL